MAKYKDAQGNITEIGSPELNPDLIAAKTQVSDTTPFSTINSSTLQSTPTPDFQTPEDKPAYPVGSMETLDLTLGKRETAADDISNFISSANEELLGESAYRTSQEEAQGIADLEKTQTDLTTRFNTIKNEALAIPLQVQQESIGRGRTRAGVAPIETARLRENAIEALTVNSLLEASRGNLTTAQSMVDRAVKQKYDPIKEKIAVATSNLELIIASPSYGLEEKNRAKKQLEIQAERERKATREASDYEIANAMAAAAVANNPGDQNALFSAQELLKLDPSSPNYLQRAYQLLGRFQSDPAKTQRDIDAHLMSQANIDKAREDSLKAPLERKRLEAEISKILADAEKAKQSSKLLSVMDAQRLGVPYGTTQEQATALGIKPGGNSQVNTLKVNAVQTIASLLQKMKDRVGTSAVGKSSILGSFGAGLIPGTDRADFVTQFDHLKSLLSLDNVKFLKGQGNVSDAERALLDNASGIADGLSRSQTEEAFLNSLVQLEAALKKESGIEDSIESQATTQGYDYAQMRADGFTDEQIKEALGQ